MKTIHPVIIGIDTHKATHVAVAIDTQGTRLAALSIPTNPKGYLELERWPRSLGKVVAFGIDISPLLSTISIDTARNFPEHCDTLNH